MCSGLWFTPLPSSECRSSTSTPVGASHEGLRHRPQGGGVVRGTVRPLCWSCKLSSISPPPLHAAGCSGNSPPLTPALQSLVNCLCFMPEENTKETPACRPIPSGSASSAINGDGLNRRVTSGPRIPPGEITRCVLYGVKSLSCALPLVLPPFPHAGVPREWIIRCFDTLWGRICVLCFLTPLLSTPENSPLLSP